MNTTNSTNNIAQAPDRAGKHLHKCDKCGLDYVHYHPHKRAEHPQFSYQCPNPDCEWYFEKGQSKGPEKSASGRTTPATAVEGSGTPRTETYAERSVRIAFKEGRIKCGNVEHFRMVAKPGQQYKVCERKRAADIIAQMKIGADARCDCERTSCKEAWAWNVPGVFETDWVQPGSYHRGWGKYEPTSAPRRVMPLNFNLSADQIKYLHEQHPGWLFVTTGTGFHDHPVAHATTQIATYNLFHSLPKGTFLDLHGNPSGAERFNEERNGRKVKVMCNVESAKDVLRKKTKWGPAKVGDNIRYIESALRDLVRDHTELVSSLDGFTSVHTLYYYNPSELPGILAASKGKVLTAIMHRFVGESGVLNNGEQAWRRVRGEDGVCLIEQTNKLTGEKYTHPDNERWFTNHSWAPYRGTDMAGHDLNEENSLVWDCNMAGAGTYLLRICSATLREANLDASYVPEKEYVKPVKNSDAYVKKHCKVELTSFSGTTEVTIPPAYQPLFQEARLKMLGATRRDMAKYRSHAQWVALKAKGVMKSIDSVDDVQTVYNLVYASFWVDSELDKSFGAAYGPDARKAVIDIMVNALTAKNAAGFASNLLQSIRHHI
uniref:Methyltransferase n=1 Tax=Pleurotus pulmonarius virga-like virus 1 TaxID=3231516 RepID=A0AAU8HXR0_9VIRU